jgi:hypothetical protein
LKSYKYLLNIKFFYKWEKRKQSKNNKLQFNNKMLINLQAKLIKNLKKPPKNNNLLLKNKSILEKPKSLRNNKNPQRLFQKKSNKNQSKKLIRNQSQEESK